ncbi:RNA-directed DNA polymerase, eukaryota, Reverse transcriptase zinc-binding domain protein [Artemisia annua]|uniref:RNA-directed DNA polymerase, eukaryota, Reverse transcriptase zinc-binding domain protein n=1 Tax=Artemisia annua TaxID=35608 RepID=A0A2U1LQI6_ARTAN|nr:RNA-directed DNA polymerase, eukaryota, Reverse transcriptase zinc-binding domain protein [Artemisia annua]
MASYLRCASDSIPFIYLGLTVGKRMRYFDGWDVVTNRLHERLSSWKAISLTIGGRLNLIKYVLGSLPIYHISLFKAPFLESIPTDAKNEEFGVGSLHAKKLSLLSKWKWRFHTEKEAI